MGDTTYNGWTNYATWLVANDVIINHADAMQRNGERYETVQELADVFREFVDFLIDDDYGNGFAVSLARSFVSDVNWYELAEHYTDELLPDDDDEEEEADEAS